jgi:hypothetical protein
MAACRKQMGDCVDIRPVSPVPWSLIGTALDYRIRFYFPQEWIGGTNLVCHSGIQLACGSMIMLAEDDMQKMNEHNDEDLEQWLDGVHLAESLFVEFFDKLGETISTFSPAGKQLEKSSEEILLRYCVVMAALDIFYRSSYDHRSILLNPEPKKTLEELLAVSQDVWIDDLRELSWGFYNSAQSLLSLPAILNPTFTGSSSIGGADGDLIVNSCLIDIKTTTDPLKNKDWIYQLLGYVMLDWHDEYKIKEVGIYFSRQSYLLKFNLNELMAELAGKPCDVIEMRDLWQKQVSPPKRRSSSPLAPSP